MSKSLSNSNKNNDDPWNIDIFRHLDFNPLRIKKSDPTILWPRSDDKLYSPSKKSAELFAKRLAFQESSKEPSFYEKLTLDREARQKHCLTANNIPLGKSYWEKIQLKKNYSNYLRRLKRKLKKEKKIEKTFRLSREKAKKYYLFQKQQAFFHTKTNLVQLLSLLQLSSKLRQKKDYFFFQQYLQKERYYVSLLYEDYILPLRNKNRIKIDPILHENFYKKRFLTQLHIKQHRILQCFIQKLQCERMLHFLWSLQHLSLFNQEKNQLRLLLHPPTSSIYANPLATIATRYRPYVRSSYHL